MVISNVPLTRSEIYGLRIDRDARRVWVDGSETPLTFQEYELLEFLTASPGKVFTRNHLITRCGRVRATSPRERSTSTFTGSGASSAVSAGAW